MQYVTSTRKKNHLLSGPFKKRPFKFANHYNDSQPLEALTISNALKQTKEVEEKNYPLRSLPTMWNLAFFKQTEGNKIDEDITVPCNTSFRFVQNRFPIQQQNQEIEGAEIKASSNPILKSTSGRFRLNSLSHLNLKRTISQFNTFNLKRSKKCANLHLVSNSCSDSNTVAATPVKNISYIKPFNTSVICNSIVKRGQHFHSSSTITDCSCSFSPTVYLNVHSDIFHPERSMNAKTEELYLGVDETNGNGGSTKLSEYFKCKFCDKSYSSLCALKMHIQTHTRPFRCHICGKCFSRPWLLQGHLRTHTGEKPFSCRHCERAFADRSNLRAHLQIHTKDKRYLCKKCSKSFSRMSLLLKHKEKEKNCNWNLKS